MDILISIFKLLGGLALLIYGMKTLSTQLKKLSGSKLEQTLTNVTDNAFKGLLVGFLITVATQSSATTTVIIVGLVNSGILKLRNSIPIIMGANIGTTMNSQILRLANVEGNSILTLISPATIAPVLLIIGLIIIQKAEKSKYKDIGQIVFSLGLLFTGMITMVNIASSFSNLPVFREVLSKMSNPILGVLAGAVITAIVQSSAATVGILQAISTTGIMTFSSTIPIILGQNIGTCATSIIASTGGNKNARRVATVHLYFNLIGTVIFLVGIYTYQHFIGFPFWNGPIDMGGIANFHTIFNVVSTLILFPFIKQIEKLTMITVKDKKDDEDENEEKYLTELNKLDERVTKIPSIAISNANSVIISMAEIANKNFEKSTSLLKKFDNKQLEKIQEREDIIDKIDERTTKYLITLSNKNISKDENFKINALVRIDSEIEKVGDYSFALSKIIGEMKDKDIKISKTAQKSLDLMFRLTNDMIVKTIEFLKTENNDLAVDIQVLREVSEIRREKYREDHIQRLKKDLCNVESGISYLEILTTLEKIADHCYNTSICLSNTITDRNIMTKHDYIKMIYEQNNSTIKNKLNEYSLKYEI
ncbi:MAG: Na/Pi cotransporter family protein [Clostridia bacterium]|nr:Na/Pi cotransporter family protein [Clostridia bacterium]